MPRVTFKLDDPPDLAGVSYLEKHRRLSSRDRTLEVRVDGQHVFDVTVPATVFNPYRGVAANSLMELILEHAIDVTRRDVVDLGCGCGVVGLAAILRGARSVRFTDRNPNVLALRDHPLLRGSDAVAVGHLLDDVTTCSADVVLAALPTDPDDDAKAFRTDDFRAGILRPPGLLDEALSGAARVLRPGGAFVFWSHVSLAGVAPYHDLLMRVAEHFDVRSARVLRYADQGQGWFVLSACTAGRPHVGRS